MKKFELSEWLANTSRKVVTRDGRNVRIICWDRNTTYWKIVGLVTSHDSTEKPFTYDVNGNESDGCWHGNRNDLFFADEEVELTEFEKELEMMMVSFSNGNLGSDIRKEIPKQKLHNYANRLLDLARKELQPEFDKEMDKMLEETDKVVEKRGYERGREDALKDLPKWKKSTLPIPDEEYPTGFNGKYFCYKGYCVDYEKLFKTLPKEE